MREERMLVWGLHCQRCTGSVVRRVKALTGVHALLIHAATNEVIVVYEQARCNRRQIEWVIYEEGYDVVRTRSALARLDSERLSVRAIPPPTTISW